MEEQEDVDVSGVILLRSVEGEKLGESVDGKLVGRNWQVLEGIHRFWGANLECESGGIGKGV